MKAKSADDQDKQHYILNKKPFSYEADCLQETKSLSVLQNSKWGTNDETNLFKGSFSSCGKKDLKEPITSHDKTLSLAGVHSMKDMKSNTMESSDTQVLRDLVNSVPEKSQIETVPCSTQECHTIGQDISATSGIGNKDGTSFIQLKEKKGESNPIVLGNNVLKKTEQVTLNETPPVAPLRT
jgi:small ligand-binding sensory domain FIST